MKHHYSCWRWNNNKTITGANNEASNLANQLSSNLANQLEAQYRVGVFLRLKFKQSLNFVQFYEFTEEVSQHVLPLSQWKSIWKFAPQ
jgi:hypothetical protein